MSTSLELTNSGLLIPAIGATPLPISRVAPSPCTGACPAGINVKAYVSLIAEGRHGEALETIRRRCPLPGICGRICHHPCEMACKRGRYDEPVAIRALKRFVADVERDYPYPVPPPDVRHRPRVAVIGSGPAGLTTAYDLRLAGFRVTVFESADEPGGMLRYGIADYRLPREILDGEIEVLVRAGVEIRTGVRLGRDLTLAELRGSGYAATLIAIGAQRGRLLGLEGEDGIAGVEDALSLLRRVKNGDHSPIAGRVLVIGGGSTAVEAARTALRLGASSVDILYRRYREELLADEEEIAAAEDEGVRFRFLIAPRRLIQENNKLTALECIQVGLAEPDASGRRRPIEIPGTEFVIEAEHLFAATGQAVDASFAPQLTANGRMAIDEATAMTSAEGLFAAGDAVTGPSTVIDAIAGGHRAAEAIRHYFEEGRPAIREQRAERRAAFEYEISDPEPLHTPRVRPPLISPQKAGPFGEVERAFTEAEAVAEAKRCLRCGPCGECRVCASSCSKRHVMLRVLNGSDATPTLLLRTPGHVARALPSDTATSARFLHPVGPGFDARAGTAALLLPVRSRLEPERCRKCGRCVEVCSFGALSFVGPDGDIDQSVLHLEAALCRGCGLCSAVCPNHSALQSALSEEWWSDRLDSMLAAQQHHGSVVLACQRRAGSLEKTYDESGSRIDVIRLRCVGQLTAGMLLELCEQPFKQIIVAGCMSDRCRFTEGSKLAAEQVDRARDILRSMGMDNSRIAAEWSADRAGDPIERAIAAGSAEGGH